MNSTLLDRHGMKAAPVIGLLIAGACLGAGLLALVSTERRSDNDVRTQLSRLKPGDRAALEFVRDGQRREATVVLSEPPAGQRGPARRR